MNVYPHPLIAREGWPFLAISGVAALATTAFAGWWWSAPLWLIFVFVLQFFRDPARAVPGNAKSVLAPADGRIVVIEPARDPWLERDTLKISVFMNVFNVHSNRSPIDGTVMKRWYHPGKFFNADLDKASTENERNALHLRTDDGQDITCVQVAGLIARRILCYVDAGDKLERGQRYGFIRFGSRVDLYLPKDVRVKVGVGDTVSATSTILAELP
ncbi:MAG: phosphatidylserine decarboxylase [Gammaproteobacteria bacterium]|nr:phosphatidylserine decarboxylase [Rhodocyclaceae bacterium]MBU3910455.1 phosphatidylserine decarboxylase [Gammaproteobacteria bacterium]MBU4004936.1 phosphatidylserine decarboxylase [Gammaproteobacteria bacterium]MBU4020529.1 phosphatidylserine decarboxylase [Gammaproteobacteria bacterium]MBU4095605.1 phosphatidylserine decarboxylase [Gammaproteobacteria bacterium]